MSSVELTFEEAFTELEEIILTLQQGDLPLEKILAMYERAKILEKYCSDLLEQSELRVKVLSGEESPDNHPLTSI